MRKTAGSWLFLAIIASVQFTTCLAQIPLEEVVKELSYYPGKPGTTAALEAPDEEWQQVHPMAIKYDFGNFTDKPMVLFLGDSITAFGFGQNATEDYFGFVVRLNETLGKAAYLLNAAKGGSSTKGLMQIKPALFEQLAPYANNVALVVIGFGANDAVVPRIPGWHVPVANYSRNLATTVTDLRAMGIHNIMMMTPPPVGFRGHPQNADRVNNHTALYAKAVLDLGRAMHVPTVDMYGAFMAVPDWANVVMLRDHLHLSAQGNKYLHELVWDTIQKNFPRINRNGLRHWGKSMRQELP